MRLLSVLVTLCYVVTPTQAYPYYTSQPSYTGLCSNLRMNCNSNIGSFCPQCDYAGNFLPQQCWGSTGHCWCVNVITGQEIPNTNTPPGVPPVNCHHPSDGSWYCPDGWTSFGERCFSFINTPKKWIEAEVYCQFDGGNLASIHTEDENHFIMSLTRGYTQDFPQTWLGGFDAIHPGYWMWSDGSDFNYENWYNNPHGGNQGDNEEEGNDHDDENDDKDEEDDKSEEDNTSKSDEDNKSKEDSKSEEDNRSKSDEHNKSKSDEDDKSKSDEDDKEAEHPDNSLEAGKEAKRKNCLKMNYEYDLKWFYDSCTDYLPFICEKQAHRTYY